MGRSTSDIQERATRLMVKDVKEDLVEQVTSHKVELDNKNMLPTEVSKATRKIVIPDSMNKLQAAHNLVKQFEEEETYRTYNRSYSNFFINDFMIVMQNMIPKYFGMLHVSKIDTNGRPASQDYIQFAAGFDERGNPKTDKGYVGSIIAPVWQDAIIDITPPASIAIRAKMKFEADVNAFLEEIEEKLRTESAMKGQAITIKPVRGGLLAEPIRAKENKRIVLSENVNRIVSNLVIPSMKDKSKTSLLFTGDFGTGKTETALKVGITAQRKYSRTFFYLHNSELFTLVIPYLKNYAPAVVFVEDSVYDIRRFFISSSLRRFVA